MNYKNGLRAIQEMNVAGGAGCMFGAGGNSGGNVGNIDSYAPGDARVPKVLGAGGSDPYEYVNKKGKKKNKKSSKVPIYRRTFAEALTTESVDTEYILNMLLYTENINYQQVIAELIEKYNITYGTDDNCVIFEGTDAYLQGLLEYIQSVITSEPFENGEVVALIGEMEETEKIPGGKSSGKTLSDYYSKYRKQFSDLEDFYNGFTQKLNQGIRVEKEHTTDNDIAREIAMDHLWADGLEYYTALAKMETKLKH